MRFNKLDAPYQWKEEFTKYPHGYTIFEALCKWTKQVDDMVDNINNWNDYLDNFVENFEFELQEEVQSTIEKWQNEGLLDVIIESALNTELDNVKTQVDVVENQNKNNGVYLSDYLYLLDESNVDYSVPIQSAIDSLGETGGTVFLPTKSMIFKNTIHIKEGVLLKGAKGTRLSYRGDTDGVCFVMHKKSVLDNVEIFTQQDFGGIGIMIHSDYTAGDVSRDKTSGLKIKIRNIFLYSEFNPLTHDKVGLKLLSTRSTGGIWDVVVESSHIRGFNTSIEIETLDTGWVNGCTFRDLVFHHFVSVVVTKKSINSSGIDKNVFDHLQIQTDEKSRDLFDDVQSSNCYYNIDIWDMHVYKNARIGYANLRSFLQQGYQPMITLQRWLAGDSYYYYIGRMTKWGSNVRYVTLKLIGRNIRDTNSEISIMGDGVIIRVHYGNIPLDESKIKFYRDIDNNIYFKVMENEILTNISIIARYNFITGMTIGYSENEIDGLTEIVQNPNFNYYNKPTSTP